MTFRCTTDKDIKENPLNFGLDPGHDGDLGKKYLQFQERNWLVMWPPHDATASIGKAFGRIRTTIQRLLQYFTRNVAMRTANRSGSV